MGLIPSICLKVQICVTRSTCQSINSRRRGFLSGSFLLSDRKQQLPLVRMCSIQQPVLTGRPAHRGERQSGIRSFAPNSEFLKKKKNFLGRFNLIEKCYCPQILIGKKSLGLKGSAPQLAASNRNGSVQTISLV